MSDITPASDNAPVEAPAVEPAPELPAAEAPAVPAADSPASAEVPASEFSLAAPAPAPSVKVGQVVRHAWTDPTGDHEAYGVVCEVDSDNARVGVAWLAGRSGLIPLDDLEVIEKD